MLNSTPPRSGVREIEPTPGDQAERSTLAVVRSLLLVIFVIGVLGTVAELFMLRHTEDVWQLVPIGLLIAAMGVLGWWGVSRSSTSLRAFQVVMGLLVLSGVAGVLLHYQGNTVHEIESMPGIAGLDLFRKSVMGSSPTLAPGTMIQLGLVGFAYTIRHPVLMRGARGASG